MSFSEDELQSFNSILEQKLSTHRREMERAFDQRINMLRRDMEERLNLAQQEISRNLIRKLTDQRVELDGILNQRFQSQQKGITQTINQDVVQVQHQQEQQIVNLLDRTLAAQLGAIEQLIKQQIPVKTLEEAGIQVNEHPAHFEAIEVQTDLPWEDLMDVFGKALDDRLAILAATTQTTMKNWEQMVSARLQALQLQLSDELQHRQQMPYNNNATSMQEVFQSIEQLGRIIESMQVAMTSNHALLSNRLYHHQQLPLERAHPGGHVRQASTNGVNSPLSISGDRGGEE